MRPRGRDVERASHTREAKCARGEMARPFLRAAQLGLREKCRACRHVSIRFAPRRGSPVTVPLTTPEAAQPQGDRRLQPARIRIGTRGSPLALAQAREVETRLEAAHGTGRLAFEVRIIKTTGDRIQDRPLADAGGKGLFTKEIEEALLAG